MCVPVVANWLRQPGKVVNERKTQVEKQIADYEKEQRVGNLNFRFNFQVNWLHVGEKGRISRLFRPFEERRMLG